MVEWLNFHVPTRNLTIISDSLDMPLCIIQALDRRTGGLLICIRMVQGLGFHVLIRHGCKAMTIQGFDSFRPRAETKSVMK